VYVHKIVDGTVEKRGEQIFDYTVENPEILPENRDKYFVILPMTQEKIAAKVKAILAGYGYGSDDVLYVFDELSINANLK
jgi:hypothetical protein